jgi:hypothetical protein
MHQAYLLLVTALTEGATGLLLLAWPAVPLALLLGVEHAALETTLVARLTGAALFAFGLLCWPERSDRRGGTRLRLLAGVLTYDVAAAALLAYAAWSLNLGGVALWPAVVLHAALAAWCSVCLGRG